MCLCDELSQRLAERKGVPLSKGLLTKCIPLLSGEQERVYYGHPMVHFETIVEVFGGKGGGGVHGRSCWLSHYRVEGLTEGNNNADDQTAGLLIHHAGK